MLKIFPFVLAVSLAASENTPPKTDEVSKISEAMGHLIGKNLQSLGLPLDIDALVRGMQEAKEGKQSPLSEEDCVQALAALQEESMARAAEKNLEEANSFLKKNQERPEIVSLDEGKLQFEVVKKGKGETVQPYSMPLVKYKGRYLNGPSIPEEEELIDLEEAIPGFGKAIAGMQEGESRILYIHPDLGYGKQASPRPNALLIFDVEVIKADASAEAHAASNLETPPEQRNSDANTR